VLRVLLDPGDETLAGLADAVKKRVGALVRREYGATQTPELVGGPADAPRPALHLGKALTAFHRGVDGLEKAAALKDGPQKAAAYAGASAALGEAVRADAKFVEAYTRRAEAHFQLDKFQEAATDCRQALALDPDDATAHSHLGEALTQLQQYPEALASHEKAVRLEPAYAPAYNERGQTYFKAEQYPKAVADFTEAVRLNPRFKEAYMNRGYAHYKLKNADQAIADESRALEMDGTLADAWFYRGLARLLKKTPEEYEAAIKDFSEKIRLDPADPTAYLFRAQAYAARGMTAQANADRQTAKKLREKKVNP
jgi:tetratricopeptide (TPR) repeat protein